MKHPSPIDESSRFSGNLRHYHRAGGQQGRTWDDWVGDKPAEGTSKIKWLKIIGISMAVVALGGIVVGLVMALA